MKIKNYEKFIEKLSYVILDISRISYVFRYEKIENSKYWGYGVGKLNNVIEIMNFDKKKMYITIEDNAACIWKDTGSCFSIEGCIPFSLYTTKESLFCAIVLKLTEYGLV